MEEEKDIIKEQQQKAEDMLTVHYIDDENGVFTRTPGGFVSLQFNDKEYKRIAFHRSFPFTAPDLFISIRDTDPNASATANEIGMIRDMNTLRKETKVLLEEQMNHRYFAPIIQSIQDIKEEYGYAYWQVKTDRGECRFTVPLGSNIIHITESRLMITDIDGNRFEIPDINKLTPKELKKLDLYI